MASAERWASGYHAPVLVADVLTFLGASKTVLDGTLGGGGHTLALLEHGASVTALDRDSEALAAAGERLATWIDAGQLRLVLGNYAGTEHIAMLHRGRLDG